MKFSVSEVARLLKIEKSLVKTWAYRFAEYLNPLSNPSKGLSRQFVPSDLPVLAFVSYSWEEEPDMESIKQGLNAGDHNDYPFKEILTEALPFFMDPPEGLDETWKHGSLRGSMGSYVDRFSLAEEYKQAGDLLVIAAIENEAVHSVIAPIIFVYRHATELYLKSIVEPESGGKNSHDLARLLEKLRSLLQKQFGLEISDWFNNLIIGFDTFDPGGTGFRYEGPDPFSKDGEYWVDVEQLKTLMDRLAISCNNIEEALEKDL